MLDELDEQSSPSDRIYFWQQLLFLCADIAQNVILNRICVEQMSKERKQSGTSALQGIFQFLPHFNISLPSPLPTFSLKTLQHLSGIKMYT